MTSVDAAVLVVGRLRAAGIPVRDGPRWAEPPLDRADRGRWEPALRGLGAAYLTYFPDRYDRRGGLL